MVEVTKEDIRAGLDHLGWDDYDDFCAWALSNDEMNRFDELAQAFATHRHTSTAAAEARIAELEGEVARLRALVKIALIDQGKALGELWSENARQALNTLKGPTDAK